MKKLMAVAVAAISLGAFADDSYLYWMTPSSVTWKTGDTGSEYAYVAVGVMDNSTGKSVAYLANVTYGGTASAGATSVDKDSGAWYGSLGSYLASGYSFYIELFNDNLNSVGRSADLLSYAQATAYVTTFGTQAPSSTAWQYTGVFTTAAIPEPTSGLLMLIGLSALALRRKRMAKA